MTILNGDCCKCPHFKTDPSLFYAVRTTVDTGETKWKLRTHGPLSDVSVLCAGGTRLFHYDPPCNDYVLVNVRTGAIEQKFGQGITPGKKPGGLIDDWAVFYDASTYTYDAYDFNGDLLWSKTIGASGSTMMQGLYGKQFMWSDSGTLYYKEKDGTEGTWTRTAGGLYGRLTTTSGFYHLDGGVDAFGQGIDPILRLYTPTLELEYECMPSDLDSFFPTIYGPYPIGDNGIGFAFYAQDDDFAVPPRWVVVTAVGTTVNRYELANGTFPGASSTTSMFFIDQSNYAELRFPFHVRHYTGETRNWSSTAPATYNNGGTNYQGFAADSQRTVVFMDPGTNLYVSIDNSDGSAVSIATADTEFNYQIADSIYVRTPSMYLVQDNL